jgi:hypothetical protein
MVDTTTTRFLRHTTVDTLVYLVCFEEYTGLFGLCPEAVNVPHVDRT